MPEGLKIVATADVQQANKALKKLDEGFEIVSIGAKGLGLSLDTLAKKVQFFGGGVNKFIPPVITKFNAIPPAVDKASNAINKLSATTSAATQTSINFGRIIQDAPFGFLGIANNLNPLLESYQRLRAQTTSAGAAFKELGKSLTGAGGVGLALSVVSSALILFGDTIFGSGNKLKAFNFELFDLSQKAELAKNSLKDVTGKLDILQKFSNLTIDFNFTDSGERAMLKASAASVMLDKKLFKTEETLKSLQDTYNETFKQVQEKAGRSAQTLINTFPVSSIPDEAIENLKKSDQAFIKALRESSKDVDEAFKKVDEVRWERDFARATIRLTNLEEKRKKDKEILEKAISDYDQYVAGIISRAQKLSSFFKGFIDITPDFSVFDTKSDEFRKSLEFLKKFDAKDFKIILPVEAIDIMPEDVKGVATEFGDMFHKELADYFKEHPFDASIQKSITQMGQEKLIASMFGITANEDSPFTKMQRSAIVAAQTIQGILTPAFTGLFDAILKGEQPLKAFFHGLGQAVAQLIQKLISAAITAAVLSAIFPGGLGTIKGFGALFGKILGFAQGGIVSGPTLALIGEGAGTSRSNPEVVAPLDQLRSMLADMGGMGTQRVIVTGRLRGRDMALQNARTSRSQRRTTGR